MTLVIGLDEAGYGPNLGPLCIGLSAWEVPEEETEEDRGDRDEGIEDAQAEVDLPAEPQPEIDLYQLLKPVMCDKPDGRRVAVADSKVLYKPKGGLAGLERGVLAMANMAAKRAITTWPDLVARLHADRYQREAELPWTAAEYLSPVPVEATEDELAAAATLVAECPAAKLRELRALLVHPAEFNTVSDTHNSKGLALSNWTLGLLREAIESLCPFPCADMPAVIQANCDKHGGRKNYAGLLTQHFPEYTVRVVTESRPRSAYLLQRSGVTLQVDFRAKGESRLETALASMVAKYLRELSMASLNRFWQSHVPDLKPTAGYPVDAKRFKADIATKQAELGIDDAILWRNR